MRHLHSKWSMVFVNYPLIALAQSKSKKLWCQIIGWMLRIKHTNNSTLVNGIQHTHTIKRLIELRGRVAILPSHTQEMPLHSFVFVFGWRCIKYNESHESDTENEEMWISISIQFLKDTRVECTVYSRVYSNSFEYERINKPKQQQKTRSPKRIHKFSWEPHYSRSPSCRSNKVN